MIYSTLYLLTKFHLKRAKFSSAVFNFVGGCMLPNSFFSYFLVTFQAISVLTIFCTFGFVKKYFWTLWVTKLLGVETPPPPLRTIMREVETEYLINPQNMCVDHYVAIRLLQARKTPPLLTPPLLTPPLRRKMVCILFAKQPFPAYLFFAQNLTIVHTFLHRHAFLSRSGNDQSASQSTCSSKWPDSTRSCRQRRSEFSVHVLPMSAVPQASANPAWASSFPVSMREEN